MCKAWMHTHLIELQYGRRLDEGGGVCYMNAVLPGIKARQVPNHIPSMEHPDVVVMPFGDCTDLAKNYGRRFISWKQLEIQGGGRPPCLMQIRLQPHIHSACTVTESPSASTASRRSNHAVCPALTLQALSTQWWTTMSQTTQKHTILHTFDDTLPSR